VPQAIQAAQAPQTTDASSNKQIAASQADEPDNRPAALTRSLPTSSYALPNTDASLNAPLDSVSSNPSSEFSHPVLWENPMTHFLNQGKMGLIKRLRLLFFRAEIIVGRSFHNLLWGILFVKQNSSNFI
jgi:hypothetical protein